MKTWTDIKMERKQGNTQDTKVWFCSTVYLIKEKKSNLMVTISLI